MRLTEVYVGPAARRLGGFGADSPSPVPGTYVFPAGLSQVLLASRATADDLRQRFGSNRVYRELDQVGNATFNYVASDVIGVTPQFLLPGTVGALAMQVFSPGTNLAKMTYQKTANSVNDIVSQALASNMLVLVDRGSLTGALKDALGTYYKITPMALALNKDVLRITVVPMYDVPALLALTDASTGGWAVLAWPTSFGFPPPPTPSAPPPQPPPVPPPTPPTPETPPAGFDLAAFRAVAADSIASGSDPAQLDLLAAALASGGQADLADQASSKAKAIRAAALPAPPPTPRPKPAVNVAGMAVGAAVAVGIVALLLTKKQPGTYAKNYQGTDTTNTKTLALIGAAAVIYALVTSKKTNPAAAQ
jgi:hypothetical protein